MKIRLCCLLLVASISPEAYCQNYYVENNGSDNNPGTSVAEAWRTIARVNIQKFLPGDNIFFKRGDAWHQRLEVSSNGREGKNITYGAYAQGEKPVIDVRKHEKAVISCRKSFIVFKDLVLMNSQKNSLNVSVKGGGYGIKIIGVDIYNAGKNGIHIGKGGGNIHIDRAKVINSKNNGIYLSGSAINKLSNVIVENSYINKTHSNDCLTIHEDRRKNSAGSNFIIRNNYSENCAEQGFDITTGSDVLLINNVSKNNKEGGVLVGHSAKNTTIKNHRSYNEPTKKTSAAINISGKSRHTKLIYSIIMGNGYHLLRVSAQDVEIYNNLFAWNGGNSSFDIEGKTENLTVKNNIFTTMQNKTGRIRFLDSDRPPDHHTFDFDNNLYYAPNGFYLYSRATGKNYAFRKYQATFNQDLRSKNVNPRFVGRRGGDFHLRANSPALDAAIDVKLSKDHDGNTVPFGLAPDIGPYELFE